MTNIEKIRQEIDTRRQHMVEELMGHEENCEYHRIKGMHDAYVDLLTFLDYSLPEEKQPEDFPTSNEEMAKFPATHPKVEVPEKYKTPNWLFDKQPSEDLEEAAGLYLDSHKPLTRYNWGDLQDAFKAGAEWQRKQDAARRK